MDAAWRAYVAGTIAGQLPGVLGYDTSGSGRDGPYGPPPGQIPARPSCPRLAPHVKIRSADEPIQPRPPAAASRHRPEESFEVRASRITFPAEEQTRMAR